MTHPVLGEMSCWPLGNMFGSAFLSFTSTAHKINGAAYVDDGELTILAIICDEPGVGHFRNFIAECKQHYTRITLLQVTSATLRGALRRYGFKDCFYTDEDGERTEAMRWKGFHNTKGTV